MNMWPRALSHVEGASGYRVGSFGKGKTAVGMATVKSTRVIERNARRKMPFSWDYVATYLYVKPPCIFPRACITQGPCPQASKVVSRQVAGPVYLQRCGL